MQRANAGTGKKIPVPEVSARLLHQVADMAPCIKQIGIAVVSPSRRSASLQFRDLDHFACPVCPASVSINTRHDNPASFSCRRFQCQPSASSLSLVQEHKTIVPELCAVLGIGEGELAAHLRQLVEVGLIKKSKRRSALKLKHKHASVLAKLFTHFKAGTKKMLSPRRIKRNCMKSAVESQQRQFERRPPREKR